jgi:hypothetical protein
LLPLVHNEGRLLTTLKTMVPLFAAADAYQQCSNSSSSVATVVVAVPLTDIVSSRNDCKSSSRIGGSRGAAAAASVVEWDSEVFK